MNESETPAAPPERTFDNIVAVLNAVTPADVDIVEKEIKAKEAELAKLRNVRRVLLGLVDPNYLQHRARAKPAVKDARPPAQPSQPAQPVPPALAAAAAGPSVAAQVLAGPPVPTASPSPQYANRPERVLAVCRDTVKWLYRQKRPCRSGEIMRGAGVGPKYLNEVLSRPWFETKHDGVTVSAKGIREVIEAAA